MQQDIIQTYILAAAGLWGTRIPPEYVSGVARNLALFVEHGAIVDAFDDELVDPVGLIRL